MKNRREFLKESLAFGVGAGLGVEGNAAPKPNAPETYTPSFPALEIIALSRLAHGPSPQSLYDYRKLGANSQRQFQNYVEMQLSPKSIDDTKCDERIKATGLLTLTKSYKQLYADHVLAANAIQDEKKDLKRMLLSSEDQGMKVKSEVRELKRDENQLRMEPLNDLESATWLRAVYSKRQLFETVTDFWHNHFSIYAWDGKMSPLFASFDRDVIRKHAFGNFREFLEDVAKHPAMLVYLDNTLNQSGNPNENYARELFELHTLGAENYLGTKDRHTVAGFKIGKPRGYVDGDVYEAARCFTGWRVDQGGNSGNTGEFLYFDPWHDRNQKIVLGQALREYQPPLKDGHDILDLLSNHTGTSHFIAQKMCRRFVSEVPSEELVFKVAKVFHENRRSPDQLRKTFEFVLLSAEFQRSWGQKFKRPFESIAGVLRATEASFTPTDQFIKNFEKTGHRSFQWRTPDGYPEAREKWMATDSLLERWRLTNQLLSNRIDGTKIEIKDQSNLALHLLGRPLPPETNREIEPLLESGLHAEKKMIAAASVIFMTPDYQWK